MGAPFVTVDDDDSAVYRNQAGLAIGAFLSLVVDTNHSEATTRRSVGGHRLESTSRRDVRIVPLR